MTITSEQVLRITSDDDEAIDTYFGKSREEIDAIFEELLKWKASQPHLPQDKGNK